jgi:hypothetical protein
MRNKPELVIEAAFLNVQNAAMYMGISVNTLYVWRHRRQGPPSFRMALAEGSCTAGTCLMRGSANSSGRTRGRTRPSTR